MRVCNQLCSDRGAGDGAVGEAEEEVVERLRGLNSALNNQLEQQRENTTELTREKERWVMDVMVTNKTPRHCNVPRLEKNVLELTSRDKVWQVMAWLLLNEIIIVYNDNILMAIVCFIILFVTGDGSRNWSTQSDYNRTKRAGLLSKYWSLMHIVMSPLIFVHTQLSDSERSRKQSIDRSQPRNDVEISSLQESLRRAKQEITRLQNSNQEQVKFFKYCRFSLPELLLPL